jgi:hypothetical protein
MRALKLAYIMWWMHWHIIDFCLLQPPVVRFLQQPSTHARIHGFRRSSTSQALRVKQTSSSMSFVRDTVNFLMFEAQNWWSSLTWTEDSIPDLR